MRKRDTATQRLPFVSPSTFYGEASQRVIAVPDVFVAIDCYKKSDHGFIYLGIMISDDYFIRLMIGMKNYSTMIGPTTLERLPSLY